VGKITLPLQQKCDRDAACSLVEVSLRSIRHPKSASAAHDMRERQTERDDAERELENENNLLVPIHLLERHALVGILHITFSALFHDPPRV
jgi:hypothetical protein